MVNTTTTTQVSEENDNDDIVTINAGGKLFQILRSTLCLPPDDTAFTKLFRTTTTTTNYTSFEATYNILPSRWDADGNLFLDHDPELIETILNGLRAKNIEDPFDPILEPPCVAPHKTRAFRRILHHFDPTAFFYSPSTLPAEPAAAAIATVSSNLRHPTHSNGTAHYVHHVRQMSLDSHDRSEVAASSSHSGKGSTSSSRTEDDGIVEGFDYCYG